MELACVHDGAKVGDGKIDVLIKVRNDFEKFSEVELNIIATIWKSFKR